MAESTIYHIVNGDVVGDKIKALEGEIIVWREMFDFGPIYSSFTNELYKKRAHYFEELLQIPSDLFLENTIAQEKILKEIPREAEIVLWFEHDRYDQTMLLYLLNKLSDYEFRNLSMVTIDNYPGIEPFLGMGQLSETQLIELYNQKKPLTKEQIAQGVSGWNAYSSDNPLELERWLTEQPVLLPFTHQALRSHLTYFPSTKNGLNQVEELTLKFVKDGIHNFGELFRKVSNTRADDGLSNLHFSAILAELAKGDTPLITIDGDLPNFSASSTNAVVQLTEIGEAVLDGNKDRTEYCPLDWWLGGVHLNDGTWRWDGEKIVKTK